MFKKILSPATRLFKIKGSAHDATLNSRIPDTPSCDGSARSISCWTDQRAIYSDGYGTGYRISRCSAPETSGSAQGLALHHSRYDEPDSGVASKQALSKLSVNMQRWVDEVSARPSSPTGAECRKVIRQRSPAQHFIPHYL